MIRSTRPGHGRTSRRNGILLTVMLAGILCRAEVCAQGSAAADGTLPLLRHPGDIYAMQGEAMLRRYRFDVEARVSHYDPDWLQFYGLDGKSPFYMGTTPGRRFALKPGQLVRLTGEVVPAKGFAAENLSVEVLAEADDRSVIPARGRLGEHAALNVRLVEIEGFVDWQEQIDTQHQRLALISEGHLLDTFLWLSQSGQAPLLKGAWVRAVGTYIPRVDMNDRLVSISFLVQGAERLEILGMLDKDPRFDPPINRISDLARMPSGVRVHVAGKVDSFVPGRTVTILDETGLVELRTPQERGLHVGAEIEAIGYRSSEPGEAYVDQALWRPHDRTAPPEAPQARVTLGLASQVLGLPLEKAAAGQPVKLSGVVTWGAEGYRSFYLQDRSGGVRVTFDPSVHFAGNPCNLAVEVSGVSTMGEFAPEVIAQQARFDTMMSPPEPQKLSLEEAQTGASEGRWVEMGGYVRAVETVKPWLQLDLTTRTGEFRAMLPSNTNVEGRVGAFVRLRGVCASRSNGLRQSAGVELWVPVDEHIDIEEPPLGDPYSIPFTPIGSLGRFGSELSVAHWLHTGGVVTYQARGRYLLIQDGASPLLVLSRDTAALAPGDRVDVVGIPGWDATRFMLREAAVRRNGHDEEPPPLRVPAPLSPTTTYDSHLAQLEGVLANVTAIGDEFHLTIRNGDDDFIARIDRAPGEPTPPSWQIGSSVAATGIYRLRYDVNRNPMEIEVLMRRPGDLAVTRTPPWWTVTRALFAAGLLGALALIVALWLVSLRRRVRTQTEQIRRQLERQTRLEAELERGQRLRSLGLLAGGIAHDYNNLLTVIMGNLTLSMLDEKVMAMVGDTLREVESASRRAQKLTVQLLTFAKGGDPVREALSLPEVVDRAAELASGEAGLRVEFRPPPGLWPVNADRAQLTQAIESFLCFSLASLPLGETIHVEASNQELREDDTSPVAAGRYVLLRISEHGRGIPADQLKGIFDPYVAVEFGKERLGLATAYSIIRRHGGNVDVNSPGGSGADFRIWLPSATPGPAASAPAPEKAAKRSRRLLLMDDEECIRTLGKRVLEKMGFLVTAVSNGADCVQSYREAYQSGRPFDFVILDLTVPSGMGGEEAMAELRRIDPGVRAIVSSGYSGDPVMSDYRKFGFCAVVPKPYDCKALAAVIDGLE